jgi:hypothetical protein
MSYFSNIKICVASLVARSTPSTINCPLELETWFSSNRTQVNIQNNSECNGVARLIPGAPRFLHN